MADKKKPSRWEPSHGETQKKKILKVLKDAYPLDLTQAEIAKRAGMHRNTVVVYLPELVKEGKIKVNRKIGKYVLYRVVKEGL